MSWEDFLIRSVEAGGIFLRQGPGQPRHPSLMLALSAWGLGCVVLIGSYSSYILVSALAVDLDVPFTNVATFADCLSEGRCKLFARSTSTSYFDRIVNAQKEPLLSVFPPPSSLPLPGVRTWVAV